MRALGFEPKKDEIKKMINDIEPGDMRLLPDYLFSATRNLSIWVCKEDYVTLIRIEIDIEEKWSIRLQS